MLIYELHQLSVYMFELLKYDLFDILLNGCWYDEVELELVVEMLLLDEVEVDDE